MKDITNW